MNNPESSLIQAPTIVKYGLRDILIELSVFVVLFIYIRSRKKSTRWLIVVTVLIIALTMLIHFLGLYLSVMPAYNLIQ